MINAGPVCRDCPQLAFGERRVETDGLGTSGIMLVGESPWVDEVREGRPFAGAAGAFLDRCLGRLNIKRHQLLVTNAVWCKPRKLGWYDRPDKEAAAAFHHCRPHLDELIERCQPRVLVCLGNVAMDRVLGVRGLDDRHGYVCSSAYGIPVVPTFHPSFIMQGQQKLTGPFCFALRQAQQVATGQWRRMPTNYILDDYTKMKEYLAGDLDLLAVDTETPESAKLSEEIVDEEDQSFTIVRASCSHTVGTATTFPWIEPFVSTFRQAVHRARVVIMHNANFDRPRLEVQAFSFSELHDSMWAWHFLQSDLPKGLGFVAPFYYDGEPWKPLHEAQPAFYSAVDSDATLRLYLGVKSDLQKQGRWDRWLRHCVHALPHLQSMGHKGILVDLPEQQAFKEKLQGEYQEAYVRLQAEVPEAVKPRKRYKKPREGATVVEIECPLCSQEEIEV